jgi:3-methyladenine DNA glycosylase AlkD
LFDYLSRWADDLDDATLTDTLGRELARLVKQFPQKLKMLDRWTTSPNPWRRRLAVVSLFLPKAEDNRHLVCEVEQGLQLAEKLLDDPSVVVQKGLAQLLKYARRDAPDAVQAFLDAHDEKISKVVRKSLTAQ